MINDTLIICEGDKFIRVDSTGNPVRVLSVWEARHWRLLGKAIEYRDRFAENQWQIKVFRATPLWEVGKKDNASEGRF
jgi:hypothetical protein